MAFSLIGPNDRNGRVERFWNGDGGPTPDKACDSLRFKPSTAHSHYARDELRESDVQYRDGDWVDVVGRYDAATESGLKHRLDEESIPYRVGDSIRDLSRTTAQARIIPGSSM